MFFGKMKAVTFSYDDGVTQDKRFVEILNKYNLKATFNINSELLGLPGELNIDGKKISHIKIKPEEVRETYCGHEIAVHTLTHPNLTECSEKEIIRQVECDRANLEKLVGYDVVGMAYPCGGTNNDDRVAEVIKNNTRIRYVRTITSSSNFALQNNLYRFNPSVYHMDFDKLFALGKRFVELQTDKPKLFYIWGHSYEFDIDNTWGKFEDFCKLISNRSDIYYGINRDVLL